MAFFLTSISGEGRPNVMACAWATPVSEEPPIVMVSVARESYTAELIRESGEFVISIPHSGLLKPLWVCGKTTGRDSDKFQASGLRTGRAKAVKAPVVEGCLGFIECRLWKTVEAGECFAFFGEVLSARADEERFRDGLWTVEAEVPFHLGGSRIVSMRA